MENVHEKTYEFIKRLCSDSLKEQWDLNRINEETRDFLSANCDGYSMFVANVARAYTDHRQELLLTKMDKDLREYNKSIVEIFVYEFKMFRLVYELEKRYGIFIP